jgi:hypothetical protein
MRTEMQPNTYANESRPPDDELPEPTRNRPGGFTFGSWVIFEVVSWAAILAAVLVVAA